MNSEIAMNPNKIVRYLKKLPAEFTKNDIIKYMEDHDIRMLNFRYVGGDGRLKTLNFIINSKEHLDSVLSSGERVDGSSLFSYIDAVSSDLYVVPRFRTAFVNPFTKIPAVDILCSYMTAEGKPLESSPEYVLQKAHNRLKETTGYTFEALGELEYYLFSEVDSIYPIVEQKGYHESHPFSKWGEIRRKAMEVISQIGGKIKYGHAEVGNIIHDDVEMVQQEIEFLPVPVEEAADQLVLAKWVVREIAYQFDLEVSFAPKIIVGHAGSGLHVHTRLVKDGKNAMIENNELSDVAKRVIAGYLELAPSITAFGNTVPTSFLRLVPHQEAPTSICWGDRNRSVLVRVPLGWLGVDDMLQQVNPKEPAPVEERMNKQTVEVRSPDGSANVHQLLTGLTVAANYGLELENGLEIAEKLYVSTDASKIKELKQLPASCYEAAEKLEEQREVYEKGGVFPKGMIDGLIEYLKSHNDKSLSEKLFGNSSALQELVDKFIHCG